MKDKMRKFLNSIGVEDPDRFDLDFLKISYSSSDPDRVLIMKVFKGSPWVYDDLGYFIEKMSNVQFAYEMRFEYKNAPSVDDINALFSDFALSQYHTLPSFEFTLDGETLFPNKSGVLQEYKTIINDFKFLLHFISYNFEIEDKPVETPKVEEPIAEEREPVSESHDEAPVSTSTQESSVEEFEESEASNEEEVEDVNEYVPPQPELDETSEEMERLKHEAENEYLNKIVTTSRNQLRMSKADNRSYREIRTITELLTYSFGRFTFEGYAFEGDPRLNKKGKACNTISVGDDTGVILVSLIENKNIDASLVNSFTEIEDTKEIRLVRVSGRMDVDFKKRPIIYAESLEILPTPHRSEECDDPRVELHLHTKFSAMDGTGDIDDYAATAKAMGMKALAVTDHANIQSFPAAEAAGHKYGLKMIYGCEMNMFDFPTYCYRGDDRKISKATYCVFDFETTGLDNKNDRITEFGAVIFENGLVREHIDFFVNAGVRIPDSIVAKTKITNEMIAKNGISEEEAIKRIEEFMKDTVLVSHNAPFDIGFLNDMRRRHGYEEVRNTVIDTLAISYYLFPKAGRHTLGSLSRNLGLDLYNEDDAHRADYDAEVLAKVWDCIIARLDSENKVEGGLSLKGVMNLPTTVSGIYTYLRARHTSVIVKNQNGLKSLYKLISKSSVQYLAVGGANPPTPKIPREELAKYREDFLIGSACFNGELFEIAARQSLDDLEEAVKFYDYIEIQPLENYSYLENIHDFTHEQILNILHLIIKMAEKCGVKVVATGDCHYVDPRDKVTRDVYIASRGINGSAHPLYPSFRDRLPHFENPDQHFRSTKEMLECFSYLGEEKAYEYVVTNSNWVEAQTEPLKILKDHLYTPDANLPGSAEQLRALCYENLRKTYGENPDPEIVERLERELNGIIGNGYSVTYMIAHLICKKTISEGYLFGSRGSVGSSFAAHMAEITEVNPLRPHYLCPKCHHFEWSNDPDIRSGFDLPEKKCPECDAAMKRNGQSIPFETFLGFHAEKVPDIDLNFPRDYQSRAFGHARYFLSTPEENAAYQKHQQVASPHVIRAGTISTIMTKNAIGFIKKFYYPRFLHKEPGIFDDLNIRYLGARCIGVKRTTGQHAGGIVVIPADMEIFDFTAYQFPADEPESDWLTTHYDIGSMHDSILKLDLLGHLDPLALRMMANLTGIDVHEIPFDDPKVLSLFNSVNNLGLKTNPLRFKTGAMGTPEFGTDFVQRLLEDAKPKNFNELLIVSGLSHGTNVWNSNAEDLVKSGICTLNQVVGCRDDIMNYLMGMGLDSSIAFKLMENVRKGKGVAPEYEEEMKAHNVPAYYIDSLKKISYLFPRAHACAYVMEAVRVMWFKLYHPLEFYATYFTVRCERFDLNAIAKGVDATMASIEEYRRIIAEKNGPKKSSEEEIIKSDRIAIELLDRGYKIEKVSLMESGVNDWKVLKDRNSILPPFKAISGFPVMAAENIVKAREAGGEFISKEDLSKRANVGEGALEMLEKVGALDGLSESNQMSLFDFSF